MGINTTHIVSVLAGIQLLPESPAIFNLIKGNDMSYLNGSQEQQRTTWSSLFLNVIIVAIFGWVFLFMLPVFFNFSDEVVGLELVASQQVTPRENHEIVNF